MGVGCSKESATAHDAHVDAEWYTAFLRYAAEQKQYRQVAAVHSFHGCTVREKPAMPSFKSVHPRCGLSEMRSRSSLVAAVGYVAA